MAEPRSNTAETVQNVDAPRIEVEAADEHALNYHDQHTPQDIKEKVMEERVQRAKTKALELDEADIPTPWTMPTRCLMKVNGTRSSDNGLQLLDGQVRCPAGTNHLKRAFGCSGPELNGYPMSHQPWMDHGTFLDEKLSKQKAERKALLPRLHRLWSTRHNTVQ